MQVIVHYICPSCEEREVKTQNQICVPCLAEAEYGPNGALNEPVGNLILGQFYCHECSEMYREHKKSPVHRINLDVYSQICCFCRKVVFRGRLNVNLWSGNPEPRW